MGQSPTVLVAGADESVRQALDVCFPDLAMDRFETGRAAMNALLKSHYDLVVLDHRLQKPDGVKLLEYLANHPRLREAQVIYCLGKHVDAALPRRLVTELGVTSLIYHPVEPEELCFQMARLLGLPSPVALPRLTVDTRRTTSRGDGEGGLLLAVGLGEDMVADLIPRATARRLRTAVSEDWQSLTAAEWIEDPPQLLLVDLSGPERKERMALFGRIHELELNTQVIALVGEELQDRVEASNRGAARVLTKPFTIEAVMDAIYDVLESNKEEQLKILVVDDDPLTLANLQWLLTQTGYRVQTLSQPLAFWESLESFVPDMVILDVIMPAVSGLDLCRAVRTDLRWRDLPLLFLTIQSDAVTAHNLFQAGADDFLNKPLHSLEVLTRVTNRLSRARTARSADRDGLTGVLTRRRAAPTLRRLLRMADRRDIPFSLCVLDLDNFKQVNDTHGHPAGDQVLAALGKLLHRAFRNEDVVARWGGEEFVVGLYGMPSSTASRRLRGCLEKLRKRIFRGPSGPFGATFSAGVAEYPRDGEDIQTLYAQADAALYEAKQKGRDQVVEVSEQRQPTVSRVVRKVDIALVAPVAEWSHLLADGLNETGYSSVWFESTEEATAQLTVTPAELQAKLIVLDLDSTGSLLEDLRLDRRRDFTQVLAVTGQTNAEVRLWALDQGAYDCLEAGCGLPLMLRKLDRAMQFGYMSEHMPRPTAARS